jgi:uncharacterized ferritin-like protein (DUF455 family)
MELRDFAQRVLFADTLEEKLAPPSTPLTDETPGKAMATPDQPGRPDALIFRVGERLPLPRFFQLGDDEERGRLLHFFANHELLAAELMALVLLKFPEAPSAFRMGVAKTLQEEQMHTRLYQRRLVECGVVFGSQPVNGFFWGLVSTMETPVDYVSRLSLTFEQANLDFSRHFAHVFEQAGDKRTAKILDRIYRDEIAHVGYGLEWFRKWKDPNESDWQSYCRRLVFPLSPSRAKGNGPFNRDGRLQAGLDLDFVNQLEVYSKSKGRTPNVYHFNPQAEWTIAQEARGLNGTMALPTAMRCLSEDLSALTLYMGRRDDVAILAQKPTLEFLKKLKNAGFDYPEIVERDAMDLADRKVGQLRPWAWSPDSAAKMAGLLDQTTLQTVSWEPAWHELHSKVFSARLANEAGFGRGRVCLCEKEVSATVVEMGGRCVLKAPYGLAGNGLRFLGEEGLSDSDVVWTRQQLELEGALIVEPRFERVMDFSVQYDRDFQLLGYTHLHNDAVGRFQACSIERSLTVSVTEEVARFYYGQQRHVQRFYEQELPKLLRPHFERVGYAGPVGIDAMIAREFDGSLVHHPIIEINPRHTMGRVTLELARHVVKGERAVFQILTKKHLKKLKVTSFVALADQLEESGPLDLVIYQNGQCCLREGLLVLNDPSQAQSYLAVLRVGQSADPLLL